MEVWTDAEGDSEACLSVGVKRHGEIEILSVRNIFCRSFSFAENSPKTVEGGEPISFRRERFFNRKKSILLIFSSLFSFSFPSFVFLSAKERVGGVSGDRELSPPSLLPFCFFLFFIFSSVPAVRKRERESE